MDYAATRNMIVEAFPRLSPQLQQAARFVLDCPDEVGLNTLRDVAGMAGVQPATIVRFVKAVGFDGYKQFRAPYAQRLRGRTAEYSNRARTLQARGGDGGPALLDEIRTAEMENVRGVFEPNRLERFQEACDAMVSSRRVYVLGLRGSFSIAYAFHYAYSMFRADAVLLDGRGGAFADALRRIC
ncbi:MAG: MurR/RpiR family transcriptional regulator, partial [Rhodospirillales bacterium]|nr:MurR/RpiR family transcriptional regulator [Rhodospirillales bacterium]MCW8860841.1 MurR/RpiR family transcriptional regulator [Rhodospirillales bacterium]MCW8951444.1 MurR/RpiR family transcriptional regulator [Rhodospirillales bacterium]